MEDEVFDTFNAPQISDFFKQNDSLEESMDAFFDVNHEDESRNNTKYRNKKSSNSDEAYFSPLSELEGSADTTRRASSLERSYEEPQFQLRKSMSVGNLVLFSEEEHREEYRPNLNKICEGVRNLNMSQQKEEPAEKNEEKNHVHDMPNLCSKNRNQSLYHKNGQDFQEHLNKLAQPKHYGSVENLKRGNSGKFVSLAEAVNQFQSRTPVRFRSKPNLHQKTFEPLGRTVPESPALQTKARNRQQRVLSYEEREQIEFEKARKFKIKAHPVNKKILQGPLKPVATIEMKKYTVPEPFNITAAPPKKNLPSPTKFEFHAKPVPRSAEKPRKTVEQPKKLPTNPITPTFMKNYKAPSHKTNADHQIKAPNNVGRPLGRTKPVPFSFEVRNAMVREKRERQIQKIKEEERRAREFHAKPVPKSIYKKTDSDKNGSVKSDRSSKRTTGSTESLTIHFKAQPPIILYKEPFVPAKSEKPPTQPQPFILSSELRSHEREEFEKEKKLKEMKLEYVKKIQEEELRKREQEEIAKLRKEAEYKAQPVRKYKAVIIQPSGKVTEPCSPNFHFNALRAMKNKENIPDN